MAAVSCATVGAGNPTIGWNGGFSNSPDPAFGLRIDGALPTTNALLVLSTTAACPAVNWGICPIYAFPFSLSVATVTDGAGSASIALPIPPLPPSNPLVGLTVIAQWLVVPSVDRQTTEGLEFTIATR